MCTRPIPTSSLFVTGIARRLSYTISTIGTFVLLSACTDLSGTGTIPNTKLKPGAVQDPAGAAAMAVMAHGSFQQAFAQFVITTGLFTDELQANTRGSGTLSSTAMFFDTRRTETDGGSLYTALHTVRTYTSQAIGALAKYDPDHSANRRGALYAMKGYAELMLADLYCSGVPLSTFDFEEDFTYGPSLTTEEVYRHAIALLDTALVLAPDSVHVVTMARVGTGRALLAIGEYRAAADTVAPVATDARASELVQTCPFSGCFSSVKTAEFNLAVEATVADGEGNVGLPFLAPYDPRSVSTQIAATQYGFLVYFPDKFSQGGVDVLDVANGVEARLIEAEADVRSNGTQWLQMLNTLRTDGTVTTYERTDIPGVSPGPAGVIDTTWGPGTGVGLLPPAVIADAGPQCPLGDNGNPPHPVCTDTVWYKGLHPLTDPGATLTGQAAITARVDLLFAERARWLFLTGHRQGDLRRLVRDPAYHRPRTTVYPSGVYPGVGSYSSAIDVPVPDAERINSHFTGCLGRD